jgi:hypothetical protein
VHRQGELIRAHQPHETKSITAIDLQEREVLKRLLRKL